MQNAGAPTQNIATEAADRDLATSAQTKGTTTVADTVVQKIAGLATREVSGVYALGGGAARAFSSLRERIPGATASAGQGVSVEVGERQAAIDLHVLVEYGVSIVDLSRSVRRNVIGAVEQMTGLEVVEVNIAVTDVHIPGEDEGDRTPEPGRVR
ncbi:Asp23/Gls24 family envelope stress response protein [Actinosynnema pretiosum subsp. pretiosum]|uniref:Asp23/Gls24 family envelope stress response protein n=1 Tax=Actinosynnema pretiosum subsp. pretiosum TaxID=103721 RepID=A0AA45LCY5_9PSEU|nr:Asp23/Gls24 family envelope stress response protein [Actinosynnema pretiosum subsp. pretiosum]